MSQNNEITVAENQVDFLAFVSSLSKSQTPRKDCKICNSKFKAEAEAIYERTGNIQAVVNFLKDQGEETKYHSVRRHLNNHFLMDQSELNMKELAERLVKWEKLDTRDELLLQRYICLLDMEATALAAENPSLSLLERRKNIEIILKIAAQIGAYKVQLREIHQKMEPVEIVWKSLNRLVGIKIGDSKSPEVRRVLSEILDQLSNEVGEMPVEGFKEKAL